MSTILAALTSAAVALPVTLTHSMFELIDRVTVRRLDTTAARDGAVSEHPARGTRMVKRADDYPRR